MNRIPGRWMATAFLLAGLVGVGGRAVPARAQQPGSGDLDVVQLRQNFYVIAGAGANIAVQVGPAGAILVDTGSRQMSDKVPGGREAADGWIDPLHHRHQRRHRPYRRK